MEYIIALVFSILGLAGLVIRIFVGDVDAEFNERCEMEAAQKREEQRWNI